MPNHASPHSAGLDRTREPSVVSLVGNPRVRSRTTALAAAAARAISRAAAAPDPAILDLAELTQRLGAPLGEGSASRWTEPLRTVHSARLLIVATPTYKGSYTGLLKSFLDHIDGGALHGVTAIPVTTVGSPAHTLAADVHLRPLLLELGASTPTSALVVGNDLLESPDAAVLPWLERNSEILRRAFIRPSAAPAAEALA